MAATKVLMVFPRFNQNSFWSLQAACDIYGRRCPAPPLGLMTMAAMLPKDWDVKLVNRNAEELDPADIDWADIVMTGGMLPQREDTLVLIDLFHKHGKPVAIGGPDPTSAPEEYETADFRVLGEAEGVIGDFIAAWERGERKGRFEKERFTVDVTKSPIPRFDLINFKHYLYVGVQFSRGCPFTCEFCDIIELYGRAPRPKTNEQMLAELQHLYDAGYRGHVDFVDDNLIGNKKAIKRFLPDLIKWQKEHRYPFEFSTEASMNLADDAELLLMLREASFFVIFVGIESPDEATLVATQKKQNTRRSLAESVHKIYEAGMFVIAGFIVGFDTEKGNMSDGMIACIEDTGIPMAMVGMLTALPNTQLSRRLSAEGRLLPIKAGSGDQCTGGINFVPLRPKIDILTDYKRVLDTVYEPNAYFERVRQVGRVLNKPDIDSEFNWRLALHDLGFVSRLFWRMTVTMPEMRRPFWRTIIDIARNKPANLQAVIEMITFYLHLGPFAKIVEAEIARSIEDERRSPSPMVRREMAKPIAPPQPLAVAHYG